MKLQPALLHRPEDVDIPDIEPAPVEQKGLDLLFFQEMGDKSPQVVLPQVAVSGQGREQARRKNITRGSY